MENEPLANEEQQPSLDEQRIARIVNAAITSHLKRLPTLPSVDDLAAQIQAKLGAPKEKTEPSDTEKELASLRAQLESERASQRNKEIKLSLTQSLAGKVKPELMQMAVDHLFGATKILKEGVRLSVANQEFSDTQEGIQAFLDSPVGAALSIPKEAEARPANLGTPQRNPLPKTEAPQSPEAVNGNVAAQDFIASFKF